MRVLMIIPRGKLNYKGPWTPLGAISICTVLKQAGHQIIFNDRCFGKDNIKKTILESKPDVVCISVANSRVVDDALYVAKAARSFHLPVVCGGYFATENYADILKTGFVDYVSLGEGELNVPALVCAIQDKTDISEIKGIACLRGGEITVTAPYQVSDLAQLPVLDFSFCNPENYLHPYLFCQRMIYLYASKGCPSECTFCCNPRFHCHTYRVRPVEYVVEEIEYLYKNFGLDGVYFGDECWYLKRENMYAFCNLLQEKNISIYWGCELRFGVYDEEDLQYMYDNGCRWIFFGLESGDPEMLKRVKKNISIRQIRQTVAACNKIGIVAISSFIIGYPDETKQQLQNTIDLVLEIQSGVSVCNIFTPVPNSEILDELVAKNRYVLPDNTKQTQRTMAGEYSTYRCNTIPYRDLRVIRSWFMWREFTKKSVTNEAKSFEVALNAIKETWRNLRRNGIKQFFPSMFLAAKEAVPIFWFAHFYPALRKKYRLKK